MAENAPNSSSLSRRESLQIGALSLLGLLAPGSVGPAAAATTTSTSGIGASKGNGNKLAPDHGVRVTERPNDYVTPKGLKVEREIINFSDIKFKLNGYDLGNRILVMPQKMGGGVNLIDLGSGRALASLWYWNYGDYNPISHHIQDSDDCSSLIHAVGCHQQPDQIDRVHAPVAGDSLPVHCAPGAQPSLDRRFGSTVRFEVSDGGPR